nr:MAG TPA: hypothetical protein [Caudoviricetes sp.]
MHIKFLTLLITSFFFEESALLSAVLSCNSAVS